MRIGVALLILLVSARVVAQNSDTSPAVPPEFRSEAKAPAPRDASSSDQPTTPESGNSTGTPCSTGEKGEIRVTAKEVGGKLIHKVQPVYPKKARQAGIEGTVVMCAVIGKDGKIKSLQPIAGPPELIPAAMKAVKKWSYSPFHLNNQTIEIRTDIRVNFQLTPPEHDSSLEQ
jgi:TonB family protein